MTIQTVPAYLQNASHSAALFRQAISGPYNTPGPLAYGELWLAAQTSPNMSIRVGPGRAMVAGSSVSAPTLITGGSAAFTTQGLYAVLNDATATVTIAASDPTNPRIDTVYVAVQDAFYSGATNTAVLGVVTGTPAASPTAPAAPANSLVLGTVAVAANATSIVSGNVATVGQIASLANAPYAVAQGVGTIASIASGSSGNATITFPANRFTQVPFLYMTPFSSRITASISSISSTGATVNWGNWSTGPFSGTTFDWLAVQMSFAATAG